MKTPGLSSVGPAGGWGEKEKQGGGGERRVHQAEVRLQTQGTRLQRAFCLSLSTAFT